VLIDKDKLFNKYISILLGQRLKNIIVCFENLIGIPNICEVIDGTHILLVDLLSKRVTLAIRDFFNRKKLYNIMLQVVCDATKIFWNVYVSHLEGYVMVGSLKGVIYMHN
jgi:hypothetical protein